MKLNKIPSGGKATHRKKRLGRGEANGLGKTCARGCNGSKSRSGYSIAPGFEGGQMPLFRKLPQRGFNNYRFRTNYNIVNVGDLNAIEADQVIDLELLLKLNVVRNPDQGLKILGDGELTKAIKVKAEKFTKGAKEKIEAAGGEVIAIEAAAE